MACSLILGLRWQLKQPINVPSSLNKFETQDSSPAVSNSKLFFQTDKLHLETHIPQHVETEITRLSNMHRLCQGKCHHPFCTSKHVPKFFCVLFREEQGADSKNLISFTSDPCQGNNADVNPRNLEVKQNSSRTVDWLLIFLRVFPVYRTDCSTVYKNSILASLY